MSDDVKMWGDEEYFGIGYEYDPQFFLTDKQKEIQKDLIELCRTTLSVNAIESDKGYIFPRKNFEALASKGLLGLFVPEELGGMGENHVCMAMVVETVARYGCPSTAMCLTMHYGACSAVLFRYHDNPAIQDIMRRIDKDCLIGTLSYSDPETGSHFWYPISSGAEETDDGWKVMKKASWTTSGGFADWYVVQTTSPGFGGDFSDLSVWLIMADEVQADVAGWDGMGMRGNQSGALLVDNVTIPKDRMVGPKGDGAVSNDETVDPFFLINSSCAWNGIGMAMIDLAKKHTTRKRHVDVGLRVCDYPTIQDYVGEAIIGTNASRMNVFGMAKALDDLTNNCDWSMHTDLEAVPRSVLLNQLWQIKFQAAKTVHEVSDKMLHACGGTAYKAGLGMERLLRDAKAGWVMGPTNEVLRQFVGKHALLGFESLDYWNTAINERAIDNEVKKMSADEKKALADRLLSEANAAAAE